MKVFVVLAVLIAVAFSQSVDESPKPYSFSYVAEGDEGSSSHSQKADGSGTVHGYYTLNVIDGRTRVVEYRAGPEGFEANIRTNEPGMKSSAPADVAIRYSAEDLKHLLNAADVKPEPRPAPARPAGRPTGLRYLMAPVPDTQA